MVGSGFITQIIYSAAGGSSEDNKAILTENNVNILTQTGQNLDTE